MGKRLFRTALFGYNKKDVYSYINEFSLRADERLAEKDLQIKKLKDKAKNDPVLSSKTVLEDAKKEARKILDNAQIAGKLKKEQLDAQIKEQRAVLKTLQAEAKGLKRIIQNATNKFTENLPEIEDEDITLFEPDDSFTDADLAMFEEE